MKKKNYDKILFILFILVFLIFWQLSTYFGLVKAQYVSNPIAIVKDLVSFYKSGELIPSLLTTTYEAFAGLFIGIVSGVLVALLLGHIKKLGVLLEPVLIVLNSIPQIALAPLYIMWFGIGYGSKICMSSVLVFFLIFFATYSGVRNTEKQYGESAALLGASNIRILFDITLPTIIPWIISGIKAGIGASLIGAIVGEYLGATRGLGWTISFATSYFDMARVMSCLFIFLLLGYICNKCLSLIERKFIRYNTG